MQLLTYITVLYAYLVKDHLIMTSVADIVDITKLFSTTLLLPELIEQTLERGVVWVSEV
jgi:hypothetical protein